MDSAKPQPRSVTEETTAQTPLWLREADDFLKRSDSRSSASLEPKEATPTQAIADEVHADAEARVARAAVRASTRTQASIEPPEPANQAPAPTPATPSPAAPPPISFPAPPPRVRIGAVKGVASSLPVASTVASSLPVASTVASAVYVAAPPPLPSPHSKLVEAGMRAWHQEVWPRCRRLGEAAATCCCSSTTTVCSMAATTAAEAAVTDAPLVLRYVPRLVAYLPLAGAVGLVGAIASECGSAHSAGIENFSFDGVLRLKGSAAALVIAVSAPLLLDGTAARVFAAALPVLYAASLPLLGAAWAVDTDVRRDLACEFAAAPEHAAVQILIASASNGHAMGGLCLCLCPAILFMLASAGNDEAGGSSGSKGSGTAGSGASRGGGGPGHGADSHHGAGSSSSISSSHKGISSRFVDEGDSDSGDAHALGSSSGPLELNTALELRWVHGTCALLWLWLISSSYAWATEGWHLMAPAVDVGASLAFFAVATRCLGRRLPPVGGLKSVSLSHSHSHSHFPTPWTSPLAWCGVSTLWAALLTWCTQSAATHGWALLLAWCVLTLSTAGLVLHLVLHVLGIVQATSAAYASLQTVAVAAVAVLAANPAAPCRPPISHHVVARGSSAVSSAMWSNGRARSARGSSMEVALQHLREDAWLQAMPLALLSVLPWLASLEIAPWPPEHEMGRVVSYELSVLNAVSTAPLTAVLSAALVHGALCPSWLLLSARSHPAEDSHRSPLPPSLTTATGPTSRFALRVAWPSLRLFWVLFGVVLMVPEALSDLVFDVARAAWAAAALVHLVSLSCLAPRREQVAAGEVARLAQRLHLAIAVGLGAAVLALLSASPLLSRATGDSRAWAALPWPGSPSHDNLPWVCQSVMLGALIVAPPLTLTVCELEASRPRPGLDVFVLF